MSATFRIERLGAQGDGIAETEGGPLFIPFTLPGEMVTAAREGKRAMPIAIIEASPLRIDPACRHFGDCGGCALQHLETAAYRAWKRDLVGHTLQSRGIDVPVAELVPCEPKSRRRLALSARRTDAGMLLGFSREMSHTIVNIAECPIARPEIVASLEPLRSLARIICNTDKSFHIMVTATASGLDVAARGCGRLTEQARNRASDFTLRAGFARLAVEGEIVVEPRKPVIMFGDVAVSPPPGAFLQAVAAAEETMAGVVATHLSKAKRIVDLFSGSGAFALRLAKTAEVHAVESDGGALAALNNGFRFGSGLKRVTTERRDLHMRPLRARELDAFDGLVFDPPRAGAEEQAKEIAKSGIPLVAAVSCNPATLAHDLAILTAGGYRVTSVTPVDQFLWSPHVEAVALLEKPKKRR